MRILHVIPSVALHDGGPSVAIRNMARAVAARGVHVTVATTDADGPGSLDVPLDRAVVEEGVEYFYFRRGSPRSWKFSWPLTRWLAAHVADYDVVHVHALFSYATIPGCRLAHRAGVPYVLRPLGTLDPWSLAYRSWKKRPYYATIERAHVRGAAALHATSAAEAEALRALPEVGRVALVPLGVEGVGPAWRAHPEREGDPVRFVFLSRLHPVKNVPLLIDAFAALVAGGVRAALVVAGDGEPGYRESLEAQGRGRGLGDRLRFVGRIEGDAKRELLRDSHAFVLPSSHENFGLAVAEAMSAGLPVVVSDQVGLAADVEASGAGIVVPQDATALAGALRRLATDPALRGRMGAAGAVLMTERYSWAACGEALQQLYRELAGAPSPARNAEAGRGTSLDRARAGTRAGH